MAMNQVNRFQFVVRVDENTMNPALCLEWNGEVLPIGFDPMTIIELKQNHDIDAVEEVVTVMVQQLIANKTIELFEAPLTQTVLEQMVIDIIKEKKLN